MIITSEANAAANGGGASGGQTASNRNTPITAVIQNSSGTVIGFDSGTFTAPTVTLSVAGEGTYDGTSCMIDWANGMADWVKQENDLTEATTTTVEPTTKSVTTAGTAAIAADSAASATEVSNNRALLSVLLDHLNEMLYPKLEQFYPYNDFLAIFRW